MNSQSSDIGLWSEQRLRTLQELLAGESMALTINGSCMAPGLAPGSRAVVQAARWYWPGDVLVVRGYDGGLYAHRLIGVYRRRGVWRYLTQADASERPDASVPRSGVLGRLPVAVGVWQRCWALGRFGLFGLRRIVMKRRLG